MIFDTFHTLSVVI